MKFKHRIYVFLIVLFFGSLSTQSGSAQLLNLSEVQREGVAAMRSGDWEEALKIFADVVEKADKNANLLYGPKFGYFWYHKGYCELKLKKFEDAAASFEACYSRYGNKPDTAPERANAYHIRSLIKWGDALRGFKEFDQALAKYEKFLDERNKERDKFNPGELYLGMAVCNFQKENPNFEEGIEKMRTALDNKARFRVVDYEIMICFNFFCDGLINSERTITEKEKIFADFMAEYRDDVALDAYLMPAYSPMITKLSFKAAGADLIEMSSRLASLIPVSEYALSQTRAQLKSMGTRNVIRDGRTTKVAKIFTKQIDDLKKEIKNDSGVDAAMLMLVGNQAANAGHYRGAYGAFLQLEQYHAKNEKREDNLFQLVQLTALLNEVLQTEKYGRRFLEAYPDSQYVPRVRSLMLGSLFEAGKYALCIDVALRMKDLLEVGSEQHDTCIHVLGGSYYYLGQFFEAQPFLELHMNEYVRNEERKSKYDVSSTYFHAANPSRLQDFETSDRLLTAFLNKYPKVSENPYIPFARYDLANCKYSLNDKETALKLLESVEQEFPGTTNMQMVYVLKGSVLDGLKQKEAAEQAYLKGLALAKKREDSFVASEALFNLVRLLGEERKDGNPDIKRAVPFYDEFFADYPDSPFRPETAVAGVPAMAAVDRLDEALDKLRSVIVEIGQKKNRAMVILEQALNSYTEAYLLKHDENELRVHYADFPGVRFEDVELRALLSIAVIGVYEELAEAARAKDDQAKLNQAEAAVKVQFERLREKFSPEDLTNYVAIRLGDYLRSKTSSPNQSLPYFNRVLTNQNDTAFREEAMFGKAAVLGLSDDPAKNDEALAILETLVDDQNLKQSKRAEARYQIIKVLQQKRDWKGLQAATLAYLNERQNKFKRPEVAYLHAVAYYEQDKKESALKALLQLNASYIGRVQWSAPGMLMMVDILEGRGGVNKNGKTDIQVAYENAANYVQSLDKQRDKMSSDDLALFTKVEQRVRGLEESGQVTTLEQIRAEEARR